MFVVSPDRSDHVPNHLRVNFSITHREGWAIIIRNFISYSKAFYKKLNKFRRYDFKLQMLSGAAIFIMRPFGSSRGKVGNRVGHEIRAVNGAKIHPAAPNQ